MPMHRHVIHQKTDANATSLGRNVHPWPQYLAQKWINDFNAAHGTDIKFLLLPVAHPILNPIELMWSHLKRHVRQHNRDFTMESIENHTK